MKSMNLDRFWDDDDHNRLTKCDQCGDLVDETYYSQKDEVYKCLECLISEVD